MLEGIYISWVSIIVLFFSRSVRGYFKEVG